MGMNNPYDDLFERELDDAAVVSCNRCGEDDLFWAGRVLVDEDGNKHICDQADGFGEVRDDED